MYKSRNLIILNKFYLTKMDKEEGDFQTPRKQGQGQEQNRTTAGGAG